MSTNTKPPMTVALAAPRGFCAGVDRAIQIVEKALDRFGAPVYVRHEIVHNRFVVDSLRAKGAVFVEELDEVPDGVPVIFSAHGVPKSVPAEAERRGLKNLDATCPLVSKVHREAELHHSRGHKVVLIGHAGHPEVIGTMGQLPEGAVTLIETVEQAANSDLTDGDGSDLAYTTQTTLSVDDANGVITALKDRYPAMRGPRREDICFATTNRQTAVKAIAKRCDALLVIGAPNSSNSKRLVEVARKNGCPDAFLIERADELTRDQMVNVHTLGISAGASAPEVLVDEVLNRLRQWFELSIDIQTVTEENTRFKLPMELRDEPTSGDLR